MKIKVFGLICIIVVIVLGRVLFINLKNNIDASEFKVYSINQQDLKDGELGKSARLLFTGNDIEMYNWKKQEIIFKADFLKKTDIQNNEKTKPKQNLGTSGSDILKTKYTDRFVIIVNKEKIYDGAFSQPWYSSYYPEGAVIIDIENGINIYWNDINKNEDIRYDDRIYNYLKDKNVLIE